MSLKKPLCGSHSGTELESRDFCMGLVLRPHRLRLWATGREAMMAGHWLSLSSETGHVPEGYRESNRRTIKMGPNRPPQNGGAVRLTPAQQPPIAQTSEECPMMVTVTATPCLQEVAGFYLCCFLQEKEQDELDFLFSCTRVKHIAVACAIHRTQLLSCLQPRA